MISKMQKNKLKLIESNILPISFFSRPAEQVAPDLIGCKLVRKLSNGDFLWGVIVETEAYSQSEEACHGYFHRTSRNETLFGEPGHLYVYLTYGIYHCINVVTDRSNWANGVLLRALAMPGEHERIASGPGLLAKRFELNLCHDNCQLTQENDLWLASNSLTSINTTVVRTTRIGITKAKELPWRWYLKESRSISKRKRGDRCPPKPQAWHPTSSDYL